MNILPLIFAVLLVLGLFTAYQGESFKRTIALTSYYKQGMDQAEIRAFNRRQFNLFQHAKDQGGGSNSPDSTEDSPKGRAKINFNLILSKNPQDPEHAKQQLFLAKELIKVLYHDTKFYRELEQRRPQFIDELFVQLQQAAEGKTIKEPQAIEKLELQDPELQFVLYRVMKGNPFPNSQTNTSPQAADQETPDNQDDVDEEEEGSEEEEEEEIGYASLKAFMHFDTSSRIHVYLAPRPLLTAIFIDPELVEQILRTRVELHQELIKTSKEEKKDKQKELKEKFKAKFIARKREEISETLLDFRVTATNPKSDQ